MINCSQNRQRQLTIQEKLGRRGLSSDVWIPGSKDLKNTESILDLIRENKDIERDLTEDE